MNGASKSQQITMKSWGIEQKGKHPVEEEILGIHHQQKPTETETQSCDRWSKSICFKQNQQFGLFATSIPLSFWWILWDAPL